MKPFPQSILLINALELTIKFYNRELVYVFQTCAVDSKSWVLQFYNAVKSGNFAKRGTFHDADSALYITFRNFSSIPSFAAIADFCVIPIVFRTMVMKPALCRRLRKKILSNAQMSRRPLSVISAFKML